MAGTRMHQAVLGIIRDRCDGSYCCGVGSNANECCNTGSGVWIAKNGQTTNVNPTATTTGAAQSSTSSTTMKATSTAQTSTQTSPTAQGATPIAISANSTSSSSSSSSSKSPSSTGAIAGGVVGGVIAIAVIVVAALLLLRRRKNKRLANEKHNYDTYAQGMHKAPSRMYGEMDAQNAKVEMPGSNTRHEMGAEGFYNPKGNQPVHELQS
ncbi:MAG: hypothetical protein Q9202_005122 [Teloschistes flavicans]